MTSSHIFFAAMLAWLAYFNVAVLAAGGNSTSTPLRIMALGASVSFGVGSTTGNSYRKDLEDLLVADGNKVQYVGSHKNGNFSDNAVQAVSGFVISQISAAANLNVPMFKPNLVLIDAGTNNCNKGGTVPDAGTNITILINNIFRQSPGSTVILTTILRNSVAAQDACRVTVNAQYQTLATSMQAAGCKMVLVDMRSSAGPLVTDLADGRHPNDAGYVKMANVWYSGVQEAISKGFITAPSAVSAKSNSTLKSSSIATSTFTSTFTKSPQTQTAPSASATSPITSAVSTNAGSRISQNLFFIAVLQIALWVSAMI